MKRRVWLMMAMVLVMTMTLFGTGYAGWFGSDKDKKTESESANPAAASEETMPEGSEITLSGTINENSQFVSAEGEAFELADTDQGLEVKSLIGRQVEIKGTVMEGEDQSVVEVHEYKILE